MVARFVAGTSAEEAVAATRHLVDKGLLASMDHLGEDTLDLQQADATSATPTCGCSSCSPTTG